MKQSVFKSELGGEGLRKIGLGCVARFIKTIYALTKNWISNLEYICFLRCHVNKFTFRISLGWLSCSIEV